MCIQTAIHYDNRKNSEIKLFESLEHSGCTGLWSVKGQNFKIPERNGEKNVNILFIVNISLSVSHKLAFLVKGCVKGKGKYLENFFEEACNNKVSNYNSIRTLKSVFYRVINMVHG